MPSNMTFNRFLFVKITRVTPGENGQRTIWFQKPGSAAEADHKVSADKLLRGNCYDALEIGKYYAIDMESYPWRRGTHYVWVDCVELKDDKMWSSCFKQYMHEYHKTRDSENSLKAGIKVCGFKTWKLERIKRDSEDLFMY